MFHIFLLTSFIEYKHELDDRINDTFTMGYQQNVYIFKIERSRGRIYSRDMTQSLGNTLYFVVDQANDHCRNVPQTHTYNRQ